MATDKTVIANHPPHDGREWENQCARCGSSVDRAECYECAGDGWVEAYGSDFDENGAEVPCEGCNGEGGWWRCMSSAEFCQANPLPGREQQPRGTVEWFPVSEGE